jgi:Bacterial protein of unknown function (DUF937)
MNLVEIIKDQLSSAVINQLSSHVGASEGATRSAVMAAVPALLSALSGLASGGGSGSQKLVSALENLGGAGSLENLVPKMSNHPASVLEQGASILSSLFGNSTISGIVNAISKFYSIAPGASQKLLGYLAPLVLSAIASQFKGKSLNAQGLASLFADQKANITCALPSGFSLSEVPGLAAAGSAAARSATRQVETAGSSLPRWLLPLAGLAALGLLLWWFIPSATIPAPVEPVASVSRAQSPEPARAPVLQDVKRLVPDVTAFSTELKDTFTKLTEALSSVKDVPSAEAALPKLQDLESKLDIAKATMQKLADSAKMTISTLVKSSEGKLRELVDKVLAIPGVGEKIKVVADSIIVKLTDLAR